MTNTNDLKALLDSIPTPSTQGWEKVKLKQVDFYPQDRIELPYLHHKIM